MGGLAATPPLRAEPAPVVSIAGPSQELDAQVDVIEDPTHGYDLPALAQFPASQWSRPRALPFHPGFSKSVWWLRLQLRNDDKRHGLRRLLELRSPRQDLVEAALVRADGSVQRFTPTGDRLVLAFGLADSLNQSKAQALRAEREARLTQQTLAQELEQQVQARTRELERANARLSELAVTDSLTGAFNRRHFDAVLNDKVRFLRRARMGMAALCLVDVDNFKAYNDLYGHQRGDEALKAIAATLQQHLRRGGDQLHRVGGEEFAFLLGPDDHDAALAHVDAMRRAVAALAIPHSGTAAGVVSASFGLALWTSGNQELEPGDIYKAADQLLYQAKAGGRNRVIREQIG